MPGVLTTRSEQDKALELDKLVNQITSTGSTLSQQLDRLIVLQAEIEALENYDASDTTSIESRRTTMAAQLQSLSNKITP